jgi:DNA-damage-inducible protein D
MRMGDGDFAIALFHDSPIRHIWHDGRWFYSVIDCMGPLSGSRTPARYWSDLKRDLLANEQIDVYALGVKKLPLPAQDGRMSKTDCADTETMLRIIQSIKSPNAEPFKLWLARVGSDELSDEPEDERMRRLNYRRVLWRVKTSLLMLATERGIDTFDEIQAFIDSGYQGLYENLTESDLQRRFHLFPNDDPADYMVAEELGDNIFVEVQTRALVEREDIQGTERLNTAHYDVGVETRLTIQRLGGTMPENLPRATRIRPADYLPAGEEPSSDMLPTESEKQEET